MVARGVEFGLRNVPLGRDLGIAFTLDTSSNRLPIRRHREFEGFIKRFGWASGEIHKESTRFALEVVASPSAFRPNLGLLLSRCEGSE